MAVEVPPPHTPLQIPEMDKEEFSKSNFRQAFKSAMKSPAFPKVVKKLLKKENLDTLCAACPGLSEDALAQVSCH